METLQNKIDFVALVTVTNANGNGDPLNGNQPRTTYEGFGEISDVCIKRKIRNRMQDMGNRIFVQSRDRCDDGCASLKVRFDNFMKGIGKDSRTSDNIARLVCEEWADVRSFGQVFAFGKAKNENGVSIGIRGPVSIHQAVSISPVEIESMQITKSVNGEGDDPSKKSPDTMGMKHFVRFGLYEIKGSINVQLAGKTGFSEEDAETIKECLRTLFVNDASSARPDGSMEVVRLYWWRHNCKDGQYSSAQVHRSLSVKQKDDKTIPSSLEDYEIGIAELQGLEPEVIDGV